MKESLRIDELQSELKIESLQIFTCIVIRKKIENLTRFHVKMIKSAASAFLDSRSKPNYLGRIELTQQPEKTFYKDEGGAKWCYLVRFFLGFTFFSSLIFKF